MPSFLDIWLNVIWWTMCCTSGQSMPMPNATVAITILNWLRSVKALIIPSFWGCSVTLVNTSTSQNIWVQWYHPIQLWRTSIYPHRLQMIFHRLSSWAYLLFPFLISLLPVLESTHLNQISWSYTWCSCKERLPQHMVYAFLLYGLQRIFVAVAVNAITTGNILRISPIRSSTGRKVCPLKQYNTDTPLEKLEHHED